MTIWIKLNLDNTIEGAYLAPSNLSHEEQEQWIANEYEGTFVSSLIDGEKYPFVGDITKYTYDWENKTFISPAIEG